MAEGSRQVEVGRCIERCHRLTRSRLAAAPAPDAFSQSSGHGRPARAGIRRGKLLFRRFQILVRGPGLALWKCARLGMNQYAEISNPSMAAVFRNCTNVSMTIGFGANREERAMTAFVGEPGSKEQDPAYEPSAHRQGSPGSAGVLVGG